MHVLFFCSMLHYCQQSHCLKYHCLAHTIQSLYSFLREHEVMKYINSSLRKPHRENVMFVALRVESACNRLWLVWIQTDIMCRIWSSLVFIVCILHLTTTLLLGFSRLVWWCEWNIDHPCASSIVESLLLANRSWAAEMKPIEFETSCQIKNIPKRSHFKDKTVIG